MRDGIGIREAVDGFGKVVDEEMMGCFEGMVVRRGLRGATLEVASARETYVDVGGCECNGADGTQIEVEGADVDV